MPEVKELIQALSIDKQQLVTEQTHAYIKQAEELFNIKNQTVDIVFDLKGKTAGMYRVSRKMLKYKREIRYNPYIFSKYFDDNFKTTVPHEVAHYISDLLHGIRNIKPHGSEWKNIMRTFDADPSVTANYDLTGIPQRKKTLYTYQCSCREHQIGAIRHNRINKQSGKYICSFCQQVLSFKPPTVLTTP